MSPYFCYREAKNQQELEALLRLRYEVYRSSRLKGFCPENPWGLDLDCYDCHARHFGLFYCENGGQRPVGYMRVIQQNETSTAAWVRRIARRHSMELLTKVCAEPKNPFPAMNYFPNADDVLQPVINGGQYNVQSLCEGSQLIVLPEFSSVRLGLHLIESAIAICLFCTGYQCAVVACCDSHGLIYKNLCFQEMACSGKTGLEQHLPQHGALLLLLLLPHFQQNATPALRRRVELLAHTYRTHRCICFFPDRPGQYAPPTLAGPRFISLKKKRRAGKIICRCGIKYENNDICKRKSSLLSSCLQCFSVFRLQPDPNC